MTENQEDREAKRAVADLAQCFAQNRADAGRIDTAADVQPVAGRNPRENAVNQQQRFAVRLQKKIVLERQPLAQPVSDFKRKKRENRVR